MNKKGIVFCVFSAILFGIAPLITRLIYCYDVNAIGLSFYRSFFALPILYALNKKKHTSLRISLNDLKKVIFVGVFGSALTTLFLNISYGYIDIGIAATLHFMHPLFVTLFFVVILKNKLSTKKLISLILALIGVFMLVDLKKIDHIEGVLFAVASALTYAFYFSYTDYSGLKKINSLVLSFWIALVSTIIFFLMGWRTDAIVITLDMKLITLLIFNAILCQVLAVTFLQIGIQYTNAQIASFLSLFEPLTSLVIGVVILNESMNGIKIFGCLFILLSVRIHMRLN